MSSITIKNIPEGLLTRVRERAKAEHRSVNKEFIQLVEAALQGEQAGAVAREQVAQQVAAWSNLPGRWACDDAAAETAEIYAARSEGRDVAL
ncbi:MAG: Arc family DNA-binding protein [Pseudomonadales bacterium]